MRRSRWLTPVLWCSLAATVLGASSQSAVTGVSYTIGGAQMVGRFPSPERGEVVVADGHRLEDGTRLVVVIGDSFEGISARYLQWLTLEFADNGYAGTYTLPSKDVRAFYSALSVDANQQELYSRDIQGTVTVDDDARLLTVDVAMPLTNATEPAAPVRPWRVSGKYIYRVITLSQIRWPWGSH